MSALGVFSRGLLRVWFRRARLDFAPGASPPTGPALVLFNHPNALMDPLVATALLSPPRFLAKATLWKVFLLRPFLALFDPIPVQRPQDSAKGAVDRSATAATFAAVHEALAKGQTIALFPEGISHGRPDLAPLKTGAARMALGSPTPPAIHPAGLIYGDRGVFRHGVLLRLGPPIDWDDLRAQMTATPGEPPAEIVRELTARIRQALLPLTLHAPEHQELAETLAWLLGDSPRARADLEALRRRVRTLVDRLAALSEKSRARIELEVAEILEHLRKSGLRPDQVGHRYEGDEVVRFVPRTLLRHALAVVVLPAALLYWPAYRLVGWLAERLSKETDMVATHKLLAGVVFLPLWSAALAGAAAWRFGTAGAVGALVTAALAVAAVPLFDSLAEDWQAVRGFLARKDREAPRLLEARKRLLTAFPELE